MSIRPTKETEKILREMIAYPGVDYFERGTDPWHTGAFPEECKESAPHQGERESGWFAIDFFGNEVWFVPDSKIVEVKP